MDTNKQSEMDPRMARLAAIAAKFEIRPDWVGRLRALESFDIIALCDDSGSMATQVTTPDAGPYAPRATRWSELRSTISIVVDLAAALSDAGVDGAGGERARGFRRGA